MSADHSTVNEADPSPPASWRSLLKTWRYFFYLLAFGLLIVLFYAEENWRGKRAWENYSRALAQRGGTLAPSAFVPPPVRDEENFAMTPLLAPLFDFVPGTQRLRHPDALTEMNKFAPQHDAARSRLKSSKVSESNSWLDQRTDLGAWHAAMLAGTNKSAAESAAVSTNFTAEEAALGVLAGLAECAPALEELHSASKRRFCRFNINYDHDNPAGILLPHLSVVKRICQVLQLRAEANLVLGRTDEAFEDLQLMLYLVDASQCEPFIISHLVRLSEFQLALKPLAFGMGRWSEPQLRALQERIARFNFCADVSRALQGERAVFGQIVEIIQRSPDFLANMSGSSGPDFGPLLVEVTPRGWFYFESVNHAQLVDEFLLPSIDAQRKTVAPIATSRLMEQMHGRLNHSSLTLLLQHRLFASLILPSLSKLSPKTAFAQAAANSALLACALERYRLSEQDFPEHLEELQPRFLEHLPPDVVNGQPLHYRRTKKDHYSLYSIGWNERDDRGVIVPRAVSQATEAGAPTEGDWVWQPE